MKLTVAATQVKPVTWPQLVRAFLDKAPADEVYTQRELAAALGMPQLPSARFAALLGRTHILAQGTGRTTFYGCPAAIRKLRRTLTTPKT